MFQRKSPKTFVKNALLMNTLLREKPPPFIIAILFIYAYTIPLKLQKIQKKNVII